MAERTENPAPKTVEPKSQDSARASARVRSRLARIGGKTAVGNPVLDPLIKIFRDTHPKGDITSIQKAYQVAAAMHEGQKRKSGDPYITHPLAVATILAELGMTAPTLCAALLHDTVEDTSYTIEQLRKDFGDEVVHLVDGVTKLDKVQYGDSAQSETIRKMVVAMARDIRVLVIKLADRLHNMRTLRYLRQDKQERIARETIEIFAPLAHRLGMNTIKWELEDLAFATLHPKVYDEIVRLVAERAPSREAFLERVIRDVNSDLGHAKIKAKVTGRPKHYFSIYQKMLVRGREFSDIFDLVGVRILVEDVADCYAVLGVLHARWNPIPGRFKDYISVPKFNMYQSLHTTVIGPQGKPVELQIRTFAMHRRAEFGVAAHWKYKEESLAAVGSKASKGGPGGNEMVWLRELVDWQSETEDSNDFLDSLRFEMQNAGVYAYTPRGDLVQLPAKATPVDFAYAVHTEVGHTCVGARVNGRLVSLESELQSGDVVEIFTSKSPTAGPSRDWLDFVKSPRARNKIRQWFTKERREEAIDHGKDLIAKQMRKEGLPMHRLFRQANLDTVAKDLGHPDIASLYAAVGEGNVGAQNVVERVIDLAGGRAGAEEEMAESTTALPLPRSRRHHAPSRSDAGVEVVGVSGDVMVKLARCCTPVPGDDIKGFVTRGSGISVHRSDCVNFAELADMKERVVEVRWIANAKTTFLVAMQVEALDRPHLLSDITKVISDQHVNILSATLSTGRDRVAKSRFTFEMGDAKHLGAVLKAVGNVQGVFDAYRVTQ